MKYTFTTANKGDVQFDCDESSRYRNSFSRNFTVWMMDEGDCEDFENIDWAEDMFVWLVEQGVEFESVWSARFNVEYVQHIMIERDMTEGELLERASKWTTEDMKSWERSYYEIGNACLGEL